MGSDLSALRADSKGGLIVHERRWVHSSAQTRHRAQIVEDFIRNIAVPLNAVAGRLEENKTAPEMSGD
ncbi:MAG TPA: hypothetical protein VEJ36_06400 [Nitrososphaerales archaeon]|nr:hypothetical protein [Nitrososphaerales archaeon]